jgi:hypothetical protein
MIRISAGKRELWQGFSVKIPQPMHFAENCIYQLQGPNGSGKSSFIHRILIPAIQSRQDLYIICLQQQVHLQLIALKAQAVIFKPGFSIHSESDLWRYLWEDLSRMPDNLPVCVIADEAHSIVIPPDLSRPLCVIYSSHRYQLDGSIKVHFEPMDASESEIRV